MLHPAASLKNLRRKKHPRRMEPFGLKATGLALTIASALAARAVKRKSLTTAGAAAAFGVGFGSVVTGLRGFNLLVFYQVGTTATKYKKQLKATKDGTFASSATRGVSQVLSCSILAVFLSLLHAYACGAEEPIHFEDDKSQWLSSSSLTCAIFAHHACCLADTLASELGILAETSPRLITQPWRKVPPGTNGGVTVWGTICSGLGGAIIGCSYVLMDWLSGNLTSSPWSSAVSQTVSKYLIYGTLCGLIGSMIDSILGATLQETYFDEDKKLIFHAESISEQQATASKMMKPSNKQERQQGGGGLKWICGFNILNNEQVNLVSVALTTCLGGWVLGPLVF